MKTSTYQFEEMIKQPEDIDLEFKVASNQFDSKRGSLFDYCAAIANGRGGKLILGVQESPRKVMGTNCYSGTHSKLSHEIWQRIGIHIHIEELYYNDKRVLIFHIQMLRENKATEFKSELDVALSKPY